VASRAKVKKNRHADIVLERLPVGVAVYDVLEFRLLEANAFFLTNVEPFLDPHWQHGQAIGHTLAEFGARLHQICNIDVFRSVAESGKAYREDALPLATPQGSIQYLDWTLEVIPGADDEQYLLLQTMMDVTTQVQARRQVIRSGAVHLHTVLDQLSEGILIADSESSLISYANPAAAHLLQRHLPCLIGSSVSQLTQNYLATSIDGHPISPWNFYLTQVLSGEDVNGKEVVLTLPDGCKITMLISGTPLYMTFAEQKIMTSAVIVFQDITIQKNIEQRKNDFLAIANHELRTPITIIQGFAELLKMAKPEEGPDFTQNALTYIIDQSEHLARLIGAMLDISKIDQDRFALTIEQHDLHALLVEIVKSQEIAARNHHFRLQLEGLQEREQIVCRFDRAGMIQALSNLINNAVKYSPNAGDIEIGLRIMDESGKTVNTGEMSETSTKGKHGHYREALIWVKDQGMGIAPGDIPRIFERFYRAGSLDGYLSGFGIGLYIAKEIITRHGGQIWVESTKGSGSTFYTRLPLKDK
jgi:signal transduction histidine kinase